MPPILSPRACRLWVAAILVAELAVLSVWVRGEVTRSGNESARLALVQILVEEGTFVIKGSTFETVDRAWIGERFYSSKPLLLSLWLAALYAPLHGLAGLRFEADAPFLVWFLTLAGITTFSLLLTYLFQRRLRRQGLACGPASLLGLAVVATTWVFSYGVTVNNHTPAAALLFAYLWLLERTVAEPSPRLGLAAGLLVAVLAGVDIPTGGLFFLVGCGVLGLSRPRAWRTTAAFLAGAAAVTISLAVVNWAVYGYPLDAYFIPGAFDFPGRVHSPDAAGLRRPGRVVPYLFHITFGSRGFFSHMPVLLCAFPYLWRRRRSLSSVDRWTLAAAVILFAFYGTRTAIYGGWAYGFRFVVPLVPVFFWWACRWLLDEPGWWRRAVFSALCAVGLLTSWVGAQNPWPVSYEGKSTPAEAVEQQVRSPLLANLLVWSFERHPDGALFRWLSDEVYGRPVSARYLRKELVNRGEEERLPDLDREVARWRREEAAELWDRPEAERGGPQEESEPPPR